MLGIKMNTMQITERQAYMFLMALMVKENETELCSDEYLTMIDLAKFVDPDCNGWGHYDYITDWHAQAEARKAEEDLEERLWIEEAEAERRAEIEAEAYYNN